MSKSKKNFKTNRWADPEDNDYDYYDFKTAKVRRQQKQLADVLKRKDIDQIMEYEDRA